MNIYFDSPEHCNCPGHSPAGQPGAARERHDTDEPVEQYAGSPPRRGPQRRSRSTSSARRAAPHQPADEQQHPDRRLVRAELRHLRAPHPLELNSNTQYCGALAGQSLHMDSNAQIFTDSRSQGFILPGTAPHYTVSRFLDCTRRERLAAQLRLLSRGAVDAGTGAHDHHGDRGFTLPELLIGDGDRPDRDRRRGRPPCTVGVHSQPRINSQAAASSRLAPPWSGSRASCARGRSVPSATASQLSIVTYVNSATCGGAAATSSIAAESTYTCSAGACTRTEAKPDGTAPGPAVQVVSGLSSANVFSYTPPTSTAPAYVGVTLSFAGSRAQPTRSRSATGPRCETPAPRDESSAAEDPGRPSVRRRRVHGRRGGDRRRPPGDHGARGVRPGRRREPQQLQRPAEPGRQRPPPAGDGEDQTAPLRPARAHLAAGHSSAANDPNSRVSGTTFNVNASGTATTRASSTTAATRRRRAAR